MMRYGMGEHAGDIMTTGDRIHNLGVFHNLITCLKLELDITDEEIEEADKALTDLYTEEDVEEIALQMEAAGLE